MSCHDSSSKFAACSDPEDVLHGKTVRLRPQPPTVALFQRMAQAELLERCFAHVSGYRFDWGQLLEFSHGGTCSWEFCLDGVLPPLIEEGWSLRDLIQAMQAVMKDNTPRCMALSAGYHPATVLCLEVADGAEQELARAWLARVFLPYLSRIMDAGILPGLIRSAKRLGAPAENSASLAPGRFFAAAETCYRAP